jgi:hypothetical protein
VSIRPGQALRYFPEAMFFQKNLLGLIPLPLLPSIIIRAQINISVWILDSFLNSYGISKMHFDIDYFSIIFMKITG